MKDTRSWWATPFAWLSRGYWRTVRKPPSRVMSATALRTVHATRVLRREKRGSSSPVVIDSADGTWFTKLRGAAQGPPALIAEIIVAELADRLALPVPARVLVELPTQLPSDDVSDELRDLLEASSGTNVGFAMLDGARDLTPPEYENVPLPVAVSTLWLDILVQNLDRSPANPNVMVRAGRHWLIDHGAALPFQHQWPEVHKDFPHRASSLARHVFGWSAPVLREAHDTLAPLLTRDALDEAIAVVPDDYLRWFGGDPTHRRAMYSAHLWQRLQWMTNTELSTMTPADRR